MRVYVDKIPVGVASTLAQEYTIVDEDGLEMRVWRPLDYTSRTKTETGKGYGKWIENKIYLWNQIYCGR